jgi:GT2 family glycosyltransferase
MGMWRILEIELTQGIPEPLDLDGAGRGLVLLRYAGDPVGALRITCPGGKLNPEAIATALESDPDVSKRLSDKILTGWLLQNRRLPQIPRPSWSVIICTRDRPDDLQRCLEVLCPLVPPGGEVIVVDNASSGPETRAVAGRYPVRYEREDRPGLNWARARGARMAHGEILIYTDDDVIVDRVWITNMLAPFSDPRVAAVTGLTLPLELETEAQELFERYGGFGRGYVRREFDYTNIAPAAAGYVGAGANMALRRDLVVSMRLFETELDCGTAALTGGDAYAFYLLLAQGYKIVYNPSGLVWHRHRRDYASLKKTLAGYSVGGFAFLTRCLVQHRDFQAAGVAFSWIWSDHLQQVKRWLLRSPRALPLDLILAQIIAIPQGIRAYFRSRRLESEYANSPDAGQEKGDLRNGVVPSGRPQSGASPAGEPQVVDPSACEHQVAEAAEIEPTAQKNPAGDRNQPHLPEAG